jgi:hypothetical protein
MTAASITDWIEQLNMLSKWFKMVPILLMLAVNLQGLVHILYQKMRKQKG